MSLAVCFLHSAAYAAAHAGMLASLRVAGVRGEVTVMSKTAGGSSEPEHQLGKCLCDPWKQWKAQIQFQLSQKVDSATEFSKDITQAILSDDHIYTMPTRGPALGKRGREKLLEC